MEIKDNLENNLKKINWTLKHCGCDHWEVINHNEIRTGWIFWDNCLTKDGDNKYTDESESYSVVFDLRQCELKVLNNECLSITDSKSQKAFILFMNHSK